MGLKRTGVNTHLVEVTKVTDAPGKQVLCNAEKKDGSGVYQVIGTVSATWRLWQWGVDGKDQFVWNQDLAHPVEADRVRIHWLWKSPMRVSDLQIDYTTVGRDSWALDPAAQGKQLCGSGKEWGNESPCVYLYEGPNFDGAWEMQLPPPAGSISQDFPTDQLSSLIVMPGCIFEVWQGTQTGWHATFPPGRYNSAAFQAAGAQDNDASSGRVTGWSNSALKSWIKNVPAGTYDHSGIGYFENSGPTDQYFIANPGAGPVFDTNSGFGVRVLAVGDGVTKSAAVRKCARICQSLKDCAYFAVGADLEDNTRSPPPPLECGSGFAIKIGSSQNHAQVPTAEDVPEGCFQCAKGCREKDNGADCFAYECSPTAKKCFKYSETMTIFDAAEKIQPYSSTPVSGYVFCARECERGYIYAGRQHEYAGAPEHILTPSSSTRSCLECSHYCNRRHDCRMYACNYFTFDCKIFSVNTTTSAGTVKAENKWSFCKEKEPGKTSKNACFLWKTCGSYVSQPEWKSNRACDGSTIADLAVSGGANVIEQRLDCETKCRAHANALCMSWPPQCSLGPTSKCMVSWTSDGSHKPCRCAEGPEHTDGAVSASGYPPTSSSITFAEIDAWKSSNSYIEAGYQIYKMSPKVSGGWRYKPLCHTGMQFPKDGLQKCETEAADGYTETQKGTTESCNDNSQKENYGRLSMKWDNSISPSYDAITCTLALSSPSPGQPWTWAAADLGGMFLMVGDVECKNGSNV